MLLYFSGSGVTGVFLLELWFLLLKILIMPQVNILRRYFTEHACHTTIMSKSKPAPREILSTQCYFRYHRVKKKKRSQNEEKSF